MITLHNVEKFYPLGATKQYVLRQISLNIKDGEFVAFLGPSGSR